MYIHLLTRRYEQALCFFGKHLALLLFIYIPFESRFKC